MHCSRNARISQRSYSIDQPNNRASIFHQSQSLVEPFLPDRAENALFCAPNMTASSNHAISQTRPAAKTPSQGQVAACSTDVFNQFTAMSRSELEVHMQMKTMESDIYKYNYEKYEKLCGVLQSKLDKLKNFETDYNILKSKCDELQHLNAQKDQIIANMKRYCDQFVSEHARESLDGCSEATGDNMAVVDAHTRY